MSLSTPASRTVAADVDWLLAEVERLRAARLHDAAEANALIAQVQRLRAEAYRLRAENERLTSALTDAVDGMAETLPYVPDYYLAKWRLDDYLARGRAALSPPPVATPAPRPVTTTEPSADSAAQQWAAGDRVEWHTIGGTWVPARVIAGAKPSNHALIQITGTGQELAVDGRNLRLSQTPPAEVLARPITVADVRRWPHYYLGGPGRDQAAATDCEHGYTLADSCPCCDTEQADGSEQCEEHGHPASSCTYCPTGGEEGNGDA